MLIEFNRPLIFFKTRKTASTSVEAALEAALWGASPNHGKQASVYANGFVTGRPRNFGSIKRQLYALPKLVMYFTRYGLTPWGSMSLAQRRPHDSPATLLDTFPASLWEKAHKVAVVRNPWDKVVSDFFWVTRDRKLAGDLSAAFEAYVHKLLPWPVEEQVPLLIDATWTLLRFETLENDFVRLTHQLAVSDQTIALPRFKSGVRPPDLDYRDFHTSFTRETVEVTWQEWIHTFGYSFSGR